MRAEEVRIGMRVRVTADQDGAATDEMVGYVRRPKNGSWGIEFDSPVMGRLYNGVVGHNLDGTLSHNRGWYVEPQNLERADLPASGWSPSLIESLGDDIMASTDLETVITRKKIGVGLMEQLPTGSSFKSSMADIGETKPSIRIRAGRPLTAVGARIGTVSYL